MDTSTNALAEKVSNLYAIFGTWRGVADFLETNPATARKLALGEIDSNHWRKVFGLPLKAIEITPCSCGEIHTLKSCPNRRPKRKRRRVAVDIPFHFSDEEAAEFRIAIREFANYLKTGL